MKLFWITSNVYFCLRNLDLLLYYIKLSNLWHSSDLGIILDVHVEVFITIVLSELLRTESQ